MTRLQPVPERVVRFFARLEDGSEFQFEATYRQAWAKAEELAAPAIKKDLRQRAVRWELERQGHPITKRARPSPDLLDAVWLGATWLSDPRRRAAA